MKHTDLKRCPIHGTRIHGGPELYQCRRDGGHPVRLPNLDTEVIDWPAICNGCGTKESVAVIAKKGWLTSDMHLDFHLCPRCEKRLGRRLLRDVAGPVFPRFLKLVRPRGRARIAVVCFTLGALLTLPIVISH